MQKSIAKLIKLPETKKCLLYIFWIYFGMKFRDGSFAILDHTKTPAARSHAFEVDMELKERKRIIEEDLVVARQRRVEFIKRWRAKF